MSRIGKKPIPLPQGVTAEKEDRLVRIKGPKGEILQNLHPFFVAEIQDRAIAVAPQTSSKKTAALWGLTRSLLANAVEGVSRGFEKKLEMEGVGYRVSQEGGGLLVNVGFSHPVRFSAPEGITFSVEKNVITVSGVRKDAVGETAARIRAIRPPEPYKGKGIRYQGEVVRRKAGKRAA